MKKSILVLATVSLASCSGHNLRGPSSDSDASFLDVEALSEAYKTNMELDQAIDRKQIVERYTRAGSNSQSMEPSANERELEELNQKIEEKSESLKQINEEIRVRAENLNIGRPISSQYDYQDSYRVQNEKLVIQNPDNYLMDGNKIVRVYSMDLNNTKSYQLGIVNLALKETVKNNNVFDESSNDVRKYFDAKITCDADFKIKKAIFYKKISKNKEFKFRIYEQNGDSPKVLLSFNQDVTKCSLSFVNPEIPNKQYGVNLLNNSKIANKINSLRNKVDVCVLPDNSSLKGVEKFFLTDKYQSMTCTADIQDVKTLEIPFEGVKEKAEALLGQPLPSAFLEQKNPFLDLDFSKAPKLNTIIISYLVFRADFYGNLLARLVKWHADHGTDVRILVSDVITLKKDKKLLYNLQESSNNIKIQEFRYDSQAGMGLWDHLSEFHRTMHVKLLITLSDQLENNVVFFGGRNVHDGFVFKEAPDHSKLPELVQYGSGKGKDESFAHWRDFEMKVKSKDLAERVTSHLLTLWEKDSKTMFVRSINQNISTKIPADSTMFENNRGPIVRHFMSIPYKDEHALEKFYADMIDSAEKSIRLSTPYFRPTKILGEAMERAVKRGVEISLITRIDLSGDTAAIILGEVNKAGINQFLNKIKIYEYTEPAVILHSKICLIDGKYSFIGSVNLNKRSFVHDTENGIMIYDRGFNQKMNSIMDTYRNITREVTEKQKIALWKKAIIGIFDEEF